MIQKGYKEIKKKNVHEIYYLIITIGRDNGKTATFGLTV